MTALVAIIFLAGYALITLEHRYHLHKAITAAALGAVMWLVIALNEGAAVQPATDHAAAEIFKLIFFLLAAMTLVEILVHYRCFDWLRVRLRALGYQDRQQLWVIGGVAFVLSAVIDNLTATLVTLAISTRFFRGNNLLVATASVVISANAGGAWSPIGDVTTIMLWLARKFTATEIIRWVFLPSLVQFLLANVLLSRQIREDTHDTDEEAVALSASERIIVACTLASFGLPLAFSQIGLEPYFGLIFGLGVVGVLIAVFRRNTSRIIGTDDPSMDVLDGLDQAKKSHLTSDIERKLARIDVASLLFFAGILLAVSALEHLGMLEQISHALLGEDPSLARFIVGNASLGVLSAIVDNIPLTAAAISILKTNDPAIWSLLALTVGTGGSMLVVGSAAGVVAMGRVREMTFLRYIQIATLPAVLGYFAAVGVWWAEYALIH